MAMRKRLKVYPIIRGKNVIYVRYPIFVTAEIQKAIQELKYTTPHIGKWIMVEALIGGGHQYIESAMSCESREFCQKMCDVYNSHHGFRQVEVLRITAKSMGKI